MSAILQDKLTLNIRRKIAFAAAGAHMGDICIDKQGLIYIFNDFVFAIT
ncbi:TPA: hypothetical protein R8G72_000169 [Citrobacter youngae]|nr:hypothetical protein [Citrobacter sp. FDAARGOS_156]HEE0141594.1 hypothetical protein [Citrobacter youngae]MBJ9557024.1 hypothetical protein [Citrobacter sp. FDAARGOS_156]HEF0070122.1 hypothetical protein [Citrobacter youngae]HEF0084318.1 hypothetical protein [Citrobacter youngae]HEF0093348.1 hypothetical protein [Citrobacter youngae]